MQHAVQGSCRLQGAPRAQQGVLDDTLGVEGQVSTLLYHSYVLTLDSGTCRQKKKKEEEEEEEEEEKEEKKKT